MIRSENLPRAPWSEDPPELLSALRVDPEQGLKAADVAQRIRDFGQNALKETRPRHVIAILADQFRNAIIWLLLGASVLALVFDERLESLAIMAVLVINAVIGFTTEWRAVRSMEALRRLGQVQTIVRRNGRTEQISADGLVPGDIVVAEAGEVVSADLRLLESSKLQADESALTGESLPVDKHLLTLPADTPLMERSNMLFKGTSLNRGAAVGVVVGTGLNSELGRIAELVMTAEGQETPLEKRLNALGQRLVWLMLAMGSGLALVGVAVGRDMFLAIQIAIALAVAAIPEGLPIVATLALAKGMWRMARRNALIVRLSAVETLGAVNVILVDKTGTMTENRMTLTTIALPAATIEVGGHGLELDGHFFANGQPAAAACLESVDELMQTAVLCNNASLERVGPDGLTAVGDPTELALLIGAAKRGLWRADLLHDMPEIREESFTPETKMMATFNRQGGNVRIHVKGAPESVLAHCAHVRSGQGKAPLDQETRATLMARADEMAADGLRVLALAVHDVNRCDAEPYTDLVLLGLVGFLDPPRSGISEAIARCREAGVRIIMVTGDHLATASHVATRLALVTKGQGEGAALDARDLDFDTQKGAADRALNATVVARATPKQKLEMVRRLQEQGSIVAMTGDGVNDAPALKQADIGIAMGQRGTAVAKEAAAMILQDDNFSTIVEAIALGRVIYANIRKFVIYLFSCNLSEILIVTLATLAGAPLPLLPLQILFLNLVTDVFPALALGVGRGSPTLMAQRPRPGQESLLARRHWSLISAYAVLMTVAVLGSMALAVYALEFDRGQAVTVSFCTLALAQLVHVFNLREDPGAWFRNDISANAWVWAAIALCLVLILGAVYLPGAAHVLQLADPGMNGWLLIATMSSLPFLFGPLARKAVARWN